MSGAVAVVFLTLTVTFILLDHRRAGQHSTITKVGGIAGLVTAGCAWYASFAGVTNDTWKRTVLPTFPPAASTAGWGAPPGTDEQARTIRHRRSGTDEEDPVSGTTTSTGDAGLDRELERLLEVESFDPPGEFATRAP